MNLPKKITPDNLIESIVEIRMNPILEQELWAGKMEYILGKSDWEYIPTSNTDDKTPFYGLFIKGDLRFTINDKSILFNCTLKKYIGWDSYRKEIRDVVEKILKFPLAGAFSRVQIRYISEFENVNLCDCVNKNIVSCGDKFNCRGIRLDKSEDNTDIFILLNNMPTNDGKTCSTFFDVNVFERFEATDSIEKLMKSLDNAHLKEKETFFALLEDSFIEKLNPEY